MNVDAEGSFFAWRHDGQPAPGHHGIFVGHVARNRRNWPKSLERRKWPRRRAQDAEWMLASIESDLNTAANGAPIYIGASVYRGAETILRALVIVQQGRIRVVWGVTVFDTWAALYAAGKASGVDLQAPAGSGDVIRELIRIGDVFPAWVGRGVDNAIMPVVEETAKPGVRTYGLRQAGVQNPYYRRIGDGVLAIKLRDYVPERCREGPVPQGKVRGDRLTCMRRGYRLAMRHIREGVVQPRQ